mmetsp:Transcript_29044/g.33459  ORF Transcript_29044/g.33459 Transcript_29044/m.33459 type:complete len:84 (-) Transcript_29044:67-318(-)
MGLDPERQILKKIELKTSRFYKCSHGPKAGRRSTIFLMEIIELSHTNPGSVGKKRKDTSKQSDGKHYTRRKTTDQEVETNPKR